MRVCLIATTVVFIVTASLSAQSLADVARKEGDRRQTASPAGKTYTNKDLKPVRSAPSSTDASPATGDAAAPDKPADSAAPAPAAAAPVADSGKTDDSAAAAAKGEVRDQAYWSKRLSSLQEQLSRDETYADALQSRINVLTMDFINRDDPIQRDQIERDRLRAISELDRLKKTIEQDKKALADLDEEARRAGVPPGWLR